MRDSAQRDGQEEPVDPETDPESSEIASIAELFLSGIRERAQSRGVTESGFERKRPVRIPPGGAKLPAGGGIPSEGRDIASVEEVVHISDDQITSVEAGRAAGVGFDTAGELGVVNEDVPPESGDESRWESVRESSRVETVVSELSQELERTPVGYLVVAPHVEGRGGHRGRVVAAIAAAYAGSDGRAGVMRVDAGLAILSLVDAGLPADEGASSRVERIEEIKDAAGELSMEVGAWVVCPGEVTCPASAEVVRLAGRWVVPVEADSERGDGMVDAYRTIKTLAQGPRSPLTLAAVGREAMAAVEKLRAVMRRFLSWDADDVLCAERVTQAESVLMTWSDESGSTPWREMVVRMVAGETDLSETVDARTPLAEPEDRKSAPVASCLADEVEPMTIPVAVETKPRSMEHPTLRAGLMAASQTGGDLEVVDYIGTGDLGVLDSVLASEPELSLCDIAPPGTLVARMVATEAGRLELLVALTGGTSELAEVGRVLAWMKEHAHLLSRACGSAKIDPCLEPVARLYTSTRSAEHMTMLLGANAKVHTYRTLKWGEKRGLLVDAA